MFEHVTTKPDQLVRFECPDNGISVKRTPVPRNPYATGYGKRIPTQYMVRLFDQRWHRVYCACYSNVGTTYVILKGKNYIVEIV